MKYLNNVILSEAKNLASGEIDSHLHWRAAQVSVAEERSLRVTYTT